MTYALDAELLREITTKFAAGAMTLPQPAERDDWKTLRASGEAALAAIEADLPAHPEVSRTSFTATSHDGADVRLRWYAMAGQDASQAGPAAVYLHGGGMIGEAIGTPGVPGPAAPARAADLAGLPAMYMEVGELDIFRDETIEYARRAAAAGTSVELRGY